MYAFPLFAALIAWLIVLIVALVFIRFLWYLGSYFKNKSEIFYDSEENDPPTLQ